MGFFELTCPHLETTDPDEDGKAVCVHCGVVVQLTLTPALFFRTVEQFRRHGHHSMRCVETPDGWCCASSCPSRPHDSYHYGAA